MRKSQMHPEWVILGLAAIVAIVAISFAAFIFRGSFSFDAMKKQIEIKATDSQHREAARE